MENLWKIHNLCYCMVESLIEAHLFGNMEEDKGCDYDLTSIDNSNAQGDDKEKFHVRGNNSNMCNGVVIIDAFANLE